MLSNLLKEKTHLLDCTLRDGSYEIDFQFTELQTERLCRQLEDANFRFIEVGHGVGLGASNSNMGIAAASDQAYMKAAATACSNSYWGMFCIPGIASLDDISLAADQGMDFIRIGCNITEYESTRSYIQHAKEKGLLVCSNFMKSYAAPAQLFSEAAAQVSEYGSDLVYIVDSAGGMLPHEIENFAHTTRESNPDLLLGFHGHNNLGMSVANSLKAIELGFSLIDTSVAGMGRSAGNTPAEQLLSVMQRMGSPMDIDILKVLDIYENSIHELCKRKIDPIDTVSGLALFHSSYLPKIIRYSNEYNLDPRSLILALCDINKTDAPDELLLQLAQQLPARETPPRWNSLYKTSNIDEQSR